VRSAAAIVEYARKALTGVIVARTRLEVSAVPTPSPPRVLIEDGRIVPFRRSGPTFTAMGRFENVMFINGESEFWGQAAAGEVVRLYLVNWQQELC